MPAVGGLCDHLAGAARVACEVTERADLGGVGSDVAGGLARGAAGGAADGLTAWAADGAVWLIGRVADFLDTSTVPAVGAGWFAERYETMAGMALLFLVPLLMVSFVGAAVRLDAARAARSLFVHAPLAIAGMLVAVQLTAVLLELSDSASAYLADSLAGDGGRFLDQASTALGEIAGAAGLGLGGFFAAAGAAFAAFVLWIELTIRARGIEIAVLFLPLGFTALVWPATHRWCARLVRTLSALILAKPVIVAIIALAGAALGAAVDDPVAAGAGAPGTAALGDGQATTVAAGFDTVVAGVSMLALACFAPWLVWHLLAPVEGAMESALEGSRRPATAVGRAGVGPVTRPGHPAGVARATSAGAGQRTGVLPVAGAAASSATAALATGARVVGGAAARRPSGAKPPDLPTPRPARDRADAAGPPVAGHTTAPGGGDGPEPRRAAKDATVDARAPATRPRPPDPSPDSTTKPSAAPPTVTPRLPPAPHEERAR